MRFSSSSPSSRYAEPVARMTARARNVSPPSVSMVLIVARQVERRRVVPQHLGAELLGLLLQALHELRALDAVGEAGEVLHLGGVHQRTAGGDGPGDDEGRQAGTGRVDRGGVPGGTGPDDDEIADGGGLLGHETSLRCGVPDGIRRGCRDQPILGGICSAPAPDRSGQGDLRQLQPERAVGGRRQLGDPQDERSASRPAGSSVNTASGRTVRRPAACRRSGRTRRSRGSRRCRRCRWRAGSRC